MQDQLTRIFEPRRAELLRTALRFQAQLHIDILIDYGSHTMNFTIDHRLSTFIYEINATVAIETSLKNPIPEITSVGKSPDPEKKRTGEAPPLLLRKSPRTRQS